MLWSLFQSESFKLRKSRIGSIILLAPAMGMVMGLIDPGMEGGPINPWYLVLAYSDLVYGLLFLPLMTGVFACLICRYEHQAGGWKQLLALPVTRNQVFLAKYLVLVALVLAIQLLFFGGLYAGGLAQGIEDPFPLTAVWKCVLGGWVATLPLIALQLWMSVMWKSFAAPFTVNVVFTLPTILAVNSDKFGPYYPWAQPFLMMYMAENAEDVFFVPWEQVLTVVGGSLVVFFLAGLLYFQRKAV